jgi:hypothetical protein
MKTKLKLISGLAASLLLAAGLHAAAEKLDPITKDLGSRSSTDTKTPISVMDGPPSTCRIEE